MGIWLTLALGAVLPVIVVVAIVLLRLRTLQQDRRAAQQQALRFGVGTVLGAVTAVLISAAVIGLVLLLKWALGR